MKKAVLFFALCLVSASAFANPVNLVNRVTERVVSVTRTVNKLDIDVETARMFEQVEDFIYSYGYAPAGSPFSRTLGETLNTYTVQVGYPVISSFPTTGGMIKSGYLPGGRALTTLHVGPYAEIGRAYIAIENHMDFYGFYSVSTPWEVYLDDPAVTPVHQLRTLVVWPVSKIAP